MTFADTAKVLRRLADAFDKVGERPWPKPKPTMEGDFAVGAIIHLLYQRDLFTATEKKTFTREEILVMIDTMGHDPEVFPGSCWELVERCEEEG